MGQFYQLFEHNAVEGHRREINYQFVIILLLLHNAINMMLLKMKIFNTNF